MATKYILVGGYPHRASDEGKAFCEEIVAGFGEPVKLLDCLFARPRENWDKAFEQDKDFFTKHIPDRKIKIQRADPEKFIEQVHWAQALYIRGGATLVLLDVLKQAGGWSKELDGKTLVGSSAGAHALAKYYFGLDDLKPGEGLGLAPVKVLTHWRSGYNTPNVDWDKAYSELNSYKEALPLLALAEGQFEIRIQ